MHFSFLRKTVAWFVFFIICFIVSVPLVLLTALLMPALNIDSSGEAVPATWLSLLPIYPAYWVSIKLALLPPGKRKVAHAFWMPATLNLITICLVTTIFGPALYRLFAPIFSIIPEDFGEFCYIVFPFMCAIMPSYVCYLLTVPDVPEWNPDMFADQTGETSQGNQGGVVAGGSDAGDAAADSATGTADGNNANNSGTRLRGRSFLDKQTVKDET